MTEHKPFQWDKIRERLTDDRDTIAAKMYAAGRLRDLGDDEEREASRIEGRRDNLIALLRGKAERASDQMQLEALIQELDR